jgi:ABC-2 type transport system permease protein
MAVLAVFAFFGTRTAIVPVTLPKDFILNSPFIITAVTIFTCQIWLLLNPVVAGDAAARDVDTGMYPLTYTSPISKVEYLGGRVLAAFILNALILLAVQMGSLLAAYAPGVNPDIIGPFRPAAYLTAYFLVAMPNALIATTVQFSAALLSGRPMVAYVGSMGLFFLSYPVTFALYFSPLGKRALLADPIGIMAIMNEMMSNWTIVEKNVRMFRLEGPMLMNRLVWIGVAIMTLGFIYLRFRFEHRAAGAVLSRLKRRSASASTTPESALTEVRISVPHVRLSFGMAAHVRQLFAIAGSSFRMLVSSAAGLFLLIAFPMFITLVLLLDTEQWGVSLIPRTGYLASKFLTAPLTHLSDFRVMVPLLIVYFAGELVWRERDARLSENVDATPIPEWVLFFGKYLGLSLVLVAFLCSLMLSGMLAQTIRGYHNFEIARYVQILFVFQLPEYLLFAVLAFLIQALVNQKYLGLLITLTAYVLIVFSSYLGVEHKMLVYSASPGWAFTDMRGFGGSVGPWLWFKLYWAAWAVLLAVVAKLMWVRGKDDGFAKRLRIARLRFTRATTTFAAVTVLLIVGLGGFVFYNTNVLNEYVTNDEMVERRAEYERRYGKYEGRPQPERTATNLQVEIYPARGGTIRGSYRLVNHGTLPIDTIHLEPGRNVDTDVRFDRAATVVVADAKLNHFIYALAQPLQPGDSLTLRFDVNLYTRGFTNDGVRKSGAGMGVFENGTQFTSGALPVIGYQPTRELMSAADRKKHGLPRQLTLAIAADIDQAAAASYPAATFEAVIATDAGQVAVGPGELRRTWTKRGRSYFHYVSDVPINGEEVFFSADYKVHRERWKHVDLQVFVHPTHVQHLDRFVRSARAALDYYSAQFGEYPYPFLQIIEQPGNFLGMGVDGSGVITGGEGMFQLDPKPNGLDMIFEVVAHEVGHQWWGMQLKPAFAEGGGVISEGLAWYSALQLIEKERGREELRRIMSRMREPNPHPPMRTGLPLLRAMDPWANYRKAPYAMHALSEYMGEARVNGALRTLVEKKASSLATTLDMYRELQAVTPDSLKPLLHDLFEVNAMWTFDTKSAKAMHTSPGGWKVTLELEAHKVSDSVGNETEVPVTEPIEIGIFAAAKPGEILGRLLYLQKHHLRSGTQTITVVVQDKPARAGIDPYNLLDWEEGDNIEEVRIAE